LNPAEQGTPEQSPVFGFFPEQKEAPFGMENFPGPGLTKLFLMLNVSLSVEIRKEYRFGNRCETQSGSVS